MVWFLTGRTQWKDANVITLLAKHLPRRMPMIGEDDRSDRRHINLPGFQKCLMMEHVRRASHAPVKRLTFMNCILACSSFYCSSSRAQETPAPPNALSRLVALHLLRLEGTVPVYYSDGLKPTALRDQARIADCSSWYSERLHVTVPVTLAVSH